MKKKHFQPVIGLEIHVELKTESKMFCSCRADHFRVKPNTQTCPTCLGLPGALPYANKKAVEWTVMAGLALGCKIPLFSKFDRKNYFYPDLPKGYQISQYDLPFAVNGKVKFEIRNSIFEVGITRVHLEEDTGKMVHRGSESLIDFNRSGVPLMELVTEPDIVSPGQAKVFLKKLQQIIRYLGISDCDMEKGTMRCEPNVSLLSGGSDPGTLPDYKVEVKNLNSFRFVEKALEYEIKRQSKLLFEGQKPLQETRGWDESRKKTFPQRSKEEAHDYRYFPEPDLPPVRWSKADIKAIERRIPELPDQKISRYLKDFRLKPDQAEILVSSMESAGYFEEAVKAGSKLKIAPIEIAKVIINKRMNTSRHSPGQLVKLMLKKKSKPTLAGQDLEVILVKVLKNNPDAVNDYKQGKTTAVEFLLGQAMRETKGASDPNETRKLIIKLMKF